MTMKLDLISHYQPDRVFAWRGLQAVSQAQALAQIHALMAALAEEPAVINLCEDRYLLTLIFCAVAARGGRCLMPAARSPQAAGELQTLYPDAHVVDDALTQQWLESHQAESPARMPSLHRDAVVATVFTSGSTGTPRAHDKCWGDLQQATGMFRQRLLANTDGMNVLATVPPQHMYGFETSVLPALWAGTAAHAGRPSMPWDIAAALAEMPAPRLLVTTPVHIRACLRANVDLPPLAGIISATAPLDPALAVEAEQRWQSPLHEIYGCTEAGSLASRRPVEQLAWQLYPEMRIEGCEPAMLTGPQLRGPVPLADRLETLPDGRFHLLGRAGDLFKLAGKRISLGELTQRLLAVDGVEDAVVFLPAGNSRTPRPAALVVAPGLSPREIAGRLAPAIDPVFVPRPLLCTDRLPRNAVGKLPDHLLQQALRELGGQTG